MRACKIKIKYFNGLFNANWLFNSKNLADKHKLSIDKKSWVKIVDSGKYINKRWNYLAEKYKLNVKITGLESISSFNFISKNNLKYKTFISQEI